MKVLKTHTLLTLGLFLWIMPENQALLHAQQPALPIPDPSVPEPIDLGSLTAQAGSTPISVTLVLQLRSRNEADSLLTLLHTPGNSQFHPVSYRK